jgi:hypothetical protein
VQAPRALPSSRRLPAFAYAAALIAAALLVLVINAER